MLEQYTAYIKANKKKLNISTLCEAINLDMGTMSKVLNEVPDVKGSAVKIPKRCEPLIAEYFESMGIKKGSI